MAVKPATGSTVNYRTRLPGKDFGVKLVGSVGDFDYMRIFGMVDTGEFTPWGTRAFGSASMATNDAVYGNRGQLRIEQGRALGDASAWALLGVLPHASRASIARALVELSGLEGAPFLVDLLSASSLERPG